jgi:hypothetical protein
MAQLACRAADEAPEIAILTLATCGALVRAGRDEEALCLLSIILNPPPEAFVSRDLRVQALALQALALAHFDRADEARAAVRDAERALREAEQLVGEDWSEQESARLLLEEAKRLTTTSSRR